MDVCLPVLKESNKSRFYSYSVRNKSLIISLITFRDCACTSFATTFLEIAVWLAANKLTLNTPKTEFLLIVKLNETYL